PMLRVRDRRPEVLKGSVVQIESQRSRRAQEVGLVKAQIIRVARLAEFPPQVDPLASPEQVFVGHLDVADETVLGAVARAEGRYAGFALLDDKAHAQRVRVVGF